ncbi:Cupin [Myxococcus fulvus]|uniref:Cupin n=1 Tax=Myxococcus fulvus TaxID=33 RepID=A0ABY1CM56_MYXFU|nr:Cupin [Myxococcus fulvus]
MPSLSEPISVESATLRRRVVLYRTLSLVLTVFLVAVLFAVKRAMTVPEDPDVEVFDVPAVFESLAQKNPDAADISDTFFFADGATVHLHVMGRGQACPLHIHRRTHEATVIVAGQAEVQQIWGEDGALTERRGTHPPGDLIASEPFTGHAWFNRAEDQMLGNLVFAAPRFDGNLYIDGEDARMQRGPEPFTFTPLQALAKLAEAGGEAVVVKLPALEGRMSSVVLARGAHSLEATRAEPVIVYVAEGSGVLAADEEKPVKVGQLWVLRRGATVRATEGSPLMFYVFRPPMDAPASVARGE